MPEEPIQLLVVGVGSIGERHLRCFQKTDRCEVALCEPNESLRKKIAEQYDVSAAFDTVETAIEHGRWSAAVIATPAPYHVPIAVQLAKLGCHLLIEKPLSTSTAGIVELQEAVAANSVVAAVGYVQRAHPALQRLKQQVDSGRFGNPLQVRVVLGHPFAQFRPAYRDVYFARREDGGGAIQDALTHFYNSVEWIVGPTTRVMTDAEHLHLDGVTVEDTVHTIARHGRVLASFALNMYEPSNDSSITVVCEQGAVCSDFKQLRCSWISEPVTDWNHEQIDVPERDTLYVIQANNFLDSIAGTDQPLCPLVDGITTLQTNLASLRSLEEGTWQEI